MKIKSFAVIVATCTILCHWDAFGCSEGIFVKEIKLTQGKVALVDDTDYEWLNQWRWYARKNNNAWYASRHSARDENNKQSTILMHRVILGVTDPKVQIDHDDTNGLNNQRYNLREASHSQNQHNQRIKAGGTSKYKGVSWNERQKKWKVSIRKNKVQIHVGCFCDEIDAAIAYNKAAIIYHGEFARLNDLTQSLL
jgi:hypothetical protein